MAKFARIRRLGVSALSALLLYCAPALADKPVIPGVAVPDLAPGETRAVMGVKRLALVIGNGAYRDQPALRRTATDARSVGAALKYLGFDYVQVETDLGVEKMHKVIDDFAEKLRQNQDALGFVYYSGHGAQPEGGSAYLIPVDLAVSLGAYDFRNTAISIDGLLEKMEWGRSGVNVIVMDGCRSNPWVRSYAGKSTADPATFSPPSANEFTARNFIGFATSEGKDAREDAPGISHSDFTQDFLTEMFRPGADIEKVFKAIQDKRRQSSQFPDYRTTLGQTAVVFRPSVTAAAAPLPAPLPVVAVPPQNYLVAPPGAVQATPTTAVHSSDDDNDLASLRSRAMAGEAAAQYQLGWALAKGRSVDKDEPQAVRWYHQAAAQGHAIAQNNLGWMLANGLGVVKDEVTAVEWYRKSAAQGNAVAECNLGWALAHGHGVAKDQVAAVEWYRKSAAQGNASAENNLGWMLANGYGAARNDEQAVDLYRKSAAQGHPPAESNLGWMLANGYGVQRNEVEAAAWYRKAADHGDAFGQYRLGRMLEKGNVLPRDEAQAAVLYRLAANQGNKDAADALQRLSGPRFAARYAKEVQE